MAIEEKLACPACGGRLIVGQYRAECRSCGRTYDVVEGIVITAPSALNRPEVEVFEKLTARYDSWFEGEKGSVLFRNELLAIKEVLGSEAMGESLEVGVGTGRFASALGVRYGIDPSLNALLLAKERGIECVQGVAERMPFISGSFDTVLLIVTICYLPKPEEALQEVRRVLRARGKLLVAFVNRNSSWGREYLVRKRAGRSPFYTPARFYSVEEVVDILKRTGFSVVRCSSTLLQPYSEHPMLEDPLPGCAEDAGFVVLLARRV